jgi:hypothetical protein
MKYTLITPKGSIKQFYTEAMANLYKELYGGVVITQQILVDNSADMDYTVTVD